MSRGGTNTTNADAPARPASYDKKVALVLQSGGALDSYQAGVCEALASSEYVQPTPVTLGARIMLFPGAAALRPYVLIRWLRSSR